MKAFFVILNLLLTLSVCQGSVLAINDRPLAEFRGGSGSGLFEVTLRPGNDDHTLILWSEGSNLQVRWGQSSLDIDELAAKKREGGQGVVYIDKLSTRTFDDKYGLLGRDSSNPVFTGSVFSCDHTSLMFQDQFDFRPTPSLPSVIKGMTLKKLSSFQCPLIVGVIDFTKPYPGIFTPLDGQQGFLVKGATVSLIIDRSKL